MERWQIAYFRHIYMCSSEKEATMLMELFEKPQLHAMEIFRIAYQVGNLHGQADIYAAEFGDSDWINADLWQEKILGTGPHLY